MAAVCPTPTSSRKRSYYDADDLDCSPFSCTPSSAKRLRNSNDFDNALFKLRSLFPMVDDATVRHVLDACAHDVDAAIAQLSAMHLASTTVATENEPPPPPAPEAGSPTPQPQTPDDWVGAFVTEMSKSTDVEDARSRAARALRAFEAFVLARSAPKDDDKVLRLERENAVLKRAVAIQAQRLKAQSDDIDRLAKKNEDQADKLKQAEHTNYSLSVHLRHSSPGALGDFNFRHPDIC